MAHVQEKELTKSAEQAPAAPTETGWQGWFRRILPKTAMGVASTVFFMGVASAFTGAVLYAYYESKQEKTEDAIEGLVTGFPEELDKAKKIIQAEGESAREQIRTQLEELQRFAPTGETLSGLLDKTQPSVWFVSTLDESGAPSVGSAFVAFSDAEQSFLLTSFNAVRAATAEPGPPVTIKKGDEEISATVFTWDPERDIALLVVEKSNLPSLSWAKDDNAVKVGDRVFAVSGLGSKGAGITQGVVADVSGSGIQHDAPVGAAFQGGPLVNSNGEVVGISSRLFAPLGFDPLAVFFAPHVRAACDTVLRCPEGGPEPGEGG